MIFNSNNNTDFDSTIMCRHAREFSSYRQIVALNTAVE